MQEAKQHFMVFFQKKNAAGDLINEYPSALEKAQLAQDTGYQVREIGNLLPDNQRQRRTLRSMLLTVPRVGRSISASYSRSACS
jgi:hypothetical protein